MDLIKNQLIVLRYRLENLSTRARLKIAMCFLSLSFLWHTLPYYFSYELKNDLEIKLNELGIEGYSIKKIIPSWHGVVLKGVVLEDNDIVISIESVTLSDTSRFIWSGSPTDAIIQGLSIKTSNPLRSSSLVKNIIRTLQGSKKLNALKVTASKFPLQIFEHQMEFFCEGDGARITKDEFSLHLNWTTPEQPNFSAQSAFLITNTYGKIVTQGKNFVIQSPSVSVVTPQFTKTFFHQTGEAFIHSTVSLNISEILEEKTKKHTVFSQPITLKSDFDLFVNKISGSARFYQQESLLAEINANIDEKALGNMSLNLSPIKLHDYGISFVDSLFSPFLYADGKIGLTADLIFKGNWIAPEMDLVLKLDETTFKAPNLTIEGLSGSFEAINFFPLKTVKLQSFKAKKIISDSLALENTSILFSCEGEECAPKEISGDFLGGTLNLHSFKHKKSEDNLSSWSFRGIIRNIDLDQSIAFTQLSGLSLSGKFSGDGVFNWANNQFSISEGTFKLSSVTAQISYTGFESIVLLEEEKKENKQQEPSNEQKTALEALKDLRCTVLDIYLMPALSNKPSELDIKIKIVGFNPKVLNGYPFEFNIQTSGQIKEALKETVKNIHIEK